jgi:translation elongation factor EF-Ts
MAESNSEALTQLRSVTGLVYNVFECKKALLSCGDDVQSAADWLVSGKWRIGKLISENHATLEQVAFLVQAETGRSAAECLTAVRNCKGCFSLALRKVQGLSITV